MLNAVTIKNKYSLSLISELVSQLRGARYFAKLDVCWGFNNVHINLEMNGKQSFVPIAASLNPS